MHIGQPLEQLIDEPTDKFRFEATGRPLQDFKQIVLHVLENQKHDSSLPEGLFELDNVLLVEHAQDFDFADCGLPDEFVLLGLLELFDSDQLFGFGVAAPQDDTVGALPYHSQNLVFLHLLYGCAVMVDATYTGILRTDYKLINASNWGVNGALNGKK